MLGLGLGCWVKGFGFRVQDSGLWGSPNEIIQLQGRSHLQARVGFLRMDSTLSTRPRWTE